MAATLTDVVKELREQSKTLTSVRNRLDEEARAREESIRQSEREKVKQRENERESKKSASSTVGGFKSGVIGGIKSATGFGLLENLSGFLKPMVTGIFAGLFSGASLMALRTKIGKMVGRGLIFGPAILLLESFGKNAFTYLFGEVNDYLKQNGLGFSNEQISGLAESASDALVNGLYLATIFGKKGLFAGFLGSLLTDSFKYMFPDVAWEEKAKLLGFELPITTETFTMIGSTIAAFFGPSLLYGAITKAFGGTALAFPGAKVGRNAKGQFKKLSGPNLRSFRLGFGGRFAAASILMAAGGIIGDYISDNFGDVAGEATKNAIDYGAIGFMLGGPWGAFAGVAVSGIVTLANVATDNINKNADRADEVALEMKEKLDKAQESWWNSVSYGMGQLIDGMFGESDVMALQKASKDALSEFKLSGILSQRTKEKTIGMADAYMAMSIENIEGLAEHANAQVIGDLLRLHSQGGIKLSDAQITRMSQIQKYLQSEISGAADDFGSEMSGFVTSYRPSAAEIITAPAQFGGIAVGQSPVMQDDPTAEISKKSQAELVEASTNSIIDEMERIQKENSSPPIVMNTTDASTNVSNQQSMITNNGPAVDIGDFMLAPNPLTGFRGAMGF